MLYPVVLKQKLFRIAEIIHLRIFGHEMSGETKGFIGNLNYTFAATVAVGMLVYLLNVLAGRWLSVGDYGRYQLALSASFLLVIPVLMGLTTASIHAIAKQSIDPGKVVSSMLPLTFFFSGVTVPLLLIFSKEIASLIGIEDDVMVAATIYTVFFSLYSVFRSILQGFLDFRKIALFETAYAAFAFGSFLALALLGFISFWVPLLAFGLGFLVFSALCIPIVWRHFSLSSVSSEAGKTLLQNGLVMVAASVSGFLLGNVDKFIINRLIDIESVALYSAYAYSAGIFLNFFLQTFITVFFPSMSKIDDSRKAEINRKINRLYIVISPLLMVSSFVFVCLSLSLFGNKYGLDYSYAGLFSLYILVQFFVSTKQWLLASFDKRGMLYSTYATILASLLNVAAVYFFTVRYGLPGAMSGLVASLILFAFINRYFLNRLLENRKE